MKILCVYTGAESDDIMMALKNLGYQAEMYDRDQDYRRVNMEEIELLAKYIREHGITHLLSVHMINNLSVAAAMTEIKYISIVWDAPYDVLFTPYGRAESCWISSFDKVDAERFQKAGFRHVQYHPLAVNRHALEKWRSEGKLDGKYCNDICFIGSLYDDNVFDEELQRIPEIMKRYFDSIFEEAAFRWDGVDRIYGKTGDEVLRYLEMVVPEFSLNNIFDVPDTEVFEDLYLVRKLGNIERIGVLNMLAERFDVTFCTYDTKSVSKLQGLRVLPPVDEGEAFSSMTARSRINLNLSLKGIRGGTPKRVLDIMGAGGFVLTSYCPETAELFEEGKEIELFRTPEELIKKAEYYLAHEKERRAIARAGQEKVLSDHTFEKYMEHLFAWAGSD